MYVGLLLGFKIFKKKKKKFIFFFLTFIKNFNNYFLKGNFMSNGWKIEATTGL